MKFVISRSSVQVRPPAPTESSSYAQELHQKRAAVSHSVSHSARTLHSALPIALVILTLCAFLTWQGYHWWIVFCDRAATAMAGPWG